VETERPKLTWAQKIEAKRARGDEREAAEDHEIELAVARGWTPPAPEPEPMLPRKPGRPARDDGAPNKAPSVEAMLNRAVTLATPISFQGISRAARGFRINKGAVKVPAHAFGPNRAPKTIAICDAGDPALLVLLPDQGDVLLRQDKGSYGGVTVVRELVARGWEIGKEYRCHRHESGAVVVERREA
jgi:hypothetical protein